MCFGNMVKTKEIQFLSFYRKVRPFWKTFLYHQLPTMMKHTHAKFAPLGFINKKRSGTADFSSKPNIPFIPIRTELSEAIFSYGFEIVMSQHKICYLNCYLRRVRRSASPRI